MEQNRPTGLEDVLRANEPAELIFSSLEVEDIFSLANTSKNLLGIYEREVRKTVPKLQPPTQSLGAYQFIELGAGPMCSAIAFWASINSGVFTEYRSLDELFKDYGLFMGLQFLRLWKEKCRGVCPNNAVLLGVDATCLVRSPCQLKTAILRFTNPNIGNQDVAAAVNASLVPAIKRLGQHENQLWVRSGRQLFKLHLPGPLIQWLQTSPESKEFKLYGLMKQTAWVIAVYRNIDLLGRFFANACEWLEKEGEVQLVVLRDYIKQWNLVELARRMGWECVSQKPIELGFKHMQTQEAREVSGKKEKVQQNILLCFRPIGLVESLQEMLQFIREMKVESQGEHLVIEVSDIGTPVNGAVIVMGHTWD